ncbi:MAG: flagellar basal body P-ring formation protein FlgA [Gammaproteobacteria bacterium]|nr:flagellar basal body P-ring formation protein FlgA [Gammaproteobacteria bacterium]
MLKKLTKNYVIVLFAILLPQKLSAETNITLDHNDLLRSVIEFVEQHINPNNSENIKITALPIDSRIVLSQCDSELSFETSNKRTFTRQFPVKVSCEHERKPWKTYVQVLVSEMQQTLVLNQNVVKGIRIEPDMVKLVSIDKHKVKYRSIVDKSAVIGGRTMRNMSKGYQIGQNDVCLVCKGDDVAIIAKSDSMMIKTSGTAIENGAKGESIKVKNTSSQRIIKGIIGDLREVYVNL